MAPFFEWDLKVVLHSVSWFEKAKARIFTSDAGGEADAGDLGLNKHRYPKARLSLSLWVCNGGGSKRGEVLTVITPSFLTGSENAPWLKIQCFVSKTIKG